MQFPCLRFLYTTTLLLVPFSKATDLGLKWNIGDPITETEGVEGSTFEFNYPNIDQSYIIDVTTQVQVTMYGKDCKVDGADTWGQLGVINSLPKSEEVFDMISLGYNNTGYDTTDGTGNIQYEFRAISSEMAKHSDFHTDFSNPTTDLNGTETHFCVRFGLYICGEEINFLESQVTLTITTGFSFEMTVAPKAKDSRFTFDQTYKVVASLCPNQPAQFNQGDAIQVCVAPDEQALLVGVVILSVDSFIWERSGVVDARQSVVNEDEAADKNTEALDGLSVITVQDDQKQIRVTTILYAVFYASTGTAKASGSATINFSEVDDDADVDEDDPDAIIRNRNRNRNRNRRLARDYSNNTQRNLQQQQQQQAFDINVDLNLADDGPIPILQTAGGTGFSTTTVGVGVVATVGIVLSTILFA